MKTILLTIFSGVISSIMCVVISYGLFFSHTDSKVATNHRTKTALSRASNTDKMIELQKAQLIDKSTNDRLVKTQTLYPDSQQSYKKYALKKINSLNPSTDLEAPTFSDLTSQSIVVLKDNYHTKRATLIKNAIAKLNPDGSQSLKLIKDEIASGTSQLQYKYANSVANILSLSKNGNQLYSDRAISGEKYRNITGNYPASVEQQIKTVKKDEADERRNAVNEATKIARLDPNYKKMLPPPLLPRVGDDRRGYNLRLERTQEINRQNAEANKIIVAKALKSLTIEIEKKYSDQKRKIAINFSAQSLTKINPTDWKLYLDKVNELCLSSWQASLIPADDGGKKILIKLEPDEK